LSAAPVTEPPMSSAAGFVAGVKAARTSVFTYVLIGTYISIGALGHDYGFTSLWVAFSTLLVWAGPGQVILITLLGTGAAPVEVALAVGLSAMRLLPMVVALLPLLKTPQTRVRSLLLPAHYIAASMWMETLRLAPRIPREGRIGFANGLGTAFITMAVVFGFVGFYLAERLPVLLVAALLFLTPISFLVSAIRNARQLADRLALGIGLVAAPLLTIYKVNLDLLWTGLVGGTAAYAIHRLREAMR
jgi:predicted branched-subunit amino acid permease